MHSNFHNSFHNHGEGVRTVMFPPVETETKKKFNERISMR